MDTIYESHGSLWGFFFYEHVHDRTWKKGAPEDLLEGKEF